MEGSKGRREPSTGEASGSRYMWCPQCGGEYRTGFTTCADCGVALTSRRPARGRTETPEPSAGARVADKGPGCLRAAVIFGVAALGAVGLLVLSLWVGASCVFQGESGANDCTSARNNSSTVLLAAAAVVLVVGTVLALLQLRPRRLKFVAFAVAALILAGAMKSLVFTSSPSSPYDTVPRRGNGLTNARSRLTAPSGFVVHVKPGSCGAQECQVASSWTDNSVGEVSFRVYARFFNSTGALLAVEVPSTTTAISGVVVKGPARSAPVGQSLCVWVVAVDETNGESPRSNEVCFTLTSTSHGDLS